MPQTIDYNALAGQARGSGGGVDYAALANQARSGSGSDSSSDVPEGVLESLGAEWNLPTLGRQLWGLVKTASMQDSSEYNPEAEKKAVQGYRDSLGEATDKLKQGDILGAANVFVRKLPGMDTAEKQWENDDKAGAIATEASELFKMYLLKKGSEAGEYYSDPGNVRQTVSKVKAFGAGVKAAAPDAATGTAKLASVLGIPQGIDQIKQGIQKGRAAYDAAPKYETPADRAPAWQGGPGPQPDAQPDAQPIQGPLPSGRVPGSIANQKPPAAPVARSAPAWQAGPGPQPDAQPDFTPTPGSLPSGRVPGSIANQQPVEVTPAAMAAPDEYTQLLDGIAQGQGFKDFSKVKDPRTQQSIRYLADAIRRDQQQAAAGSDIKSYTGPNGEQGVTDADTPPAGAAFDAPGQVPATTPEQAVEDKADFIEQGNKLKGDDIMWANRTRMADTLGRYFNKLKMTEEQVKNLTPTEWKLHSASAGVNVPDSVETKEMILDRLAK